MAQVEWIHQWARRQSHILIAASIKSHEEMNNSDQISQVWGEQTVGFFCRGTGRILSWKYRSEAKERKTPNLFFCPNLSLIQIPVD